MSGPKPRTQRIWTYRLSEEKDLIRIKVEDFRAGLKSLNARYRELVLDHKVTGNFYIGPSSTFTHLPDNVVFERVTKERF